MKKEWSLLLVVISVLSGPAWAREESNTNTVATLTPITVLGERFSWGEREFPPGSFSSVDRLTWDAGPKLRVKEQGPFGTQNDFSIHGSTFSEAGFLINGLALRNPQTEHLNADFVAPLAWFQPPEVLTGADLFRLGAGHAAGSISLQLRRDPDPGGQISVGVGTKGLVFLRGNALEAFSFYDTDVHVGGFVDTVHADQVDGYRDNGLSRAAAGGLIGFAQEDWRWDTLLTFGWRDFGARGIYGTDEKYPASQQDEYALLSSVWTYDDGEKTPTEVAFNWSRYHDVYQLYKKDSDFYQNRHLSDQLSLKGTSRRNVSDIGYIDFRAEGDAEIYETRHHTHYNPLAPSQTKRERFDRFHGSFAVMPGTCLFNRLDVSAGISTEVFSDYAPRLTPAAEVKYRLTSRTQAVLSYREGMRQPSYTELTYDAPNTTGTRDLPLGRTRTLSLDWVFEPRQRDAWRTFIPYARAGLFYMNSHNLVDWMRARPSDKWTATALRDVQTFGATAEGIFLLAANLSFKLDGGVTIKETTADYYASRYAMDYPLASTGFVLEWEFQPNELKLSYRQGVEVWKSNPERRGDDIRNVSRIELEWLDPLHEDISVTIGLSNLYNQHFEVIPGQKAVGFSGYLALKYRW